MKLPIITWKIFLERLRRDPLGPAWFALLSELTLFGYVGFAALVTLEALLPTFVTARLSLAVYLLVLLLLTALLLAFSRVLGLAFRFTLSLRHPLVLVGLLWYFVILTLSLLKFPWWALLIHIIGFFLVFALLCKISDESNKKEA